MDRAPAPTWPPQAAAGRHPGPWTGRGASWLAAPTGGAAAALARLLPRLAPSRRAARPPASPPTAPALAVARAGEAAVASYHLAVKSVRRSEGRSATAAAAYRHAARIVCEREGRTHDYRAKAGVEASILVLPAHAPAWAEDRQALWNAAEARETRVNSVTAREWELALPHELGAEGRRALVEAFARELAGRYGVAADVAIHAPHREGDKRNWHAHVLTTTRSLTAEGLTDKTRVLDAKQTGGHEVEHMRARWAEMQNHALKRASVAERVDHRTLAVQREAALAHGDELGADTLDRAPEVKLGPVVGGIERREQRAAEREGHEYVPVTERGAQVHEARQVRGLLAELVEVRAALRREVQERAELAREAYGQAREEGTDRVRAGLAALRAAAQRQAPTHGLGHEAGHGRERDDEDRHGREASAASIKERLARLLGREAPHHAQDGPVAGLPAHEVPDADAIKERLDALRERGRPAAQRGGHEEPAHGLDPINARLRAMLARERPAAERPDPLAAVAERLRDEDADVPSFATPAQAHAFREEMERRFDRVTLGRLGRGEEAALAAVAPDRLDGLCLARAYLDSRGEPERSDRRMSLVYAINGAQHDARRERERHDHGLSWGL